MKGVITIILLSLFLSSCAGLGAFKDRVIKSASALKDAEAELVIVGARGVGLGAWSRLNNPVQQCGLLMLAGIPCNLAPISAQLPVPEITVPIIPATPIMDGE